MYLLSRRTRLRQRAHVIVSSWEQNCILWEPRFRKYPDSNLVMTRPHMIRCVMGHDGSRPFLCKKS